MPGVRARAHDDRRPRCTYSVRVTQANREPATSTGWVIGRVGGAPVVLTPSWFLAAAVITLVFAPTVRSYAPHLGTATYGVALAFAALLLASVFLHELAHALMARARGQKVQDLTITVWGGRTSFEEPARTPATSALVAVVGPLVNGAVAALCWALMQRSGTGSVLTLVLFAGVVSNVFVAVFNLLPGLPMDGGYLLEALVWKITGSRRRGTLLAGWFGRVVAVLVIAWAVLLPLVLGRTPDLVTVGWSALIGMFLWSGAGQSVDGARAAARLDQVDLDQIGQDAVGVPATATLAEALSAAAAAGVPAIVLLGSALEPVGYVDAEAAAAVPEEDAARTQVSAVAVGLPPGAVVDASLVGSALVRAIGAVAHVSPVVIAVDRTSAVPQVRALVRVQELVVALDGAARARR